MANWAITDYVIEGPKDILQKIEKAIIYPTSKEGSKGWEGNVLATLGINWTSNLKEKKSLYMKGFIKDKPALEDKDGFSLLKFWAEEAWGATDFDEALKIGFPNIKVYYCTEESEDEVYATNDKEGKYFPMRFYVDTCIDNNYNSDYFIKEEKVYSWLSKITEDKIKSSEDVEKFNEDNENTDDFINIYEFKIIE